jgi:hypothetical protein
VDDADEQQMSPWCALEAEYGRYLAHERHMFAWCLERLGGAAWAEAEAAALHMYPSEPPDEVCRGFVFHDAAWHWAMLRIHGDRYWSKDRGLEVPTDDYRLESERFSSDHPGTPPESPG